MGKAAMAGVLVGLSATGVGAPAAIALGIVAAGMTAHMEEQEKQALERVETDRANLEMLNEMPEMDTKDMTKLQSEQESGKLMLGEDKKKKRKKGKSTFKIDLDPDIQGAQGIQLKNEAGLQL